MNDARETYVPLTFKRRSRRWLAMTDAPAYDTTLLNGLARAFYWQKLIDSEVMNSASEIAANEGLTHSSVSALLRLTLLAPDIIERLMAGRQPARLTLMWLKRNHLPKDWQAQRDIVASFE